MLALSLASYLSMYPLLLFPPMILLAFDRRKPALAKQSLLRFTLENGTIFSAAVMGLLLSSYLITGQSWQFLSSTYGVQLLLPDLTPNVGLWWYFFIEMFDSFRAFFLGVFWLHLAGYVGGLSIRVRTQPLFVITTLLGLFAIFKPYPSISDTSLYLALLPLYRHVLPRKFPASHTFTFLSSENIMSILSTHPDLTPSHTLHLLRRLDSYVCHPPRSRLLLFMDLRWFRQRKLLLRHHPSLVSGSLRHCRRFIIRRTTRRMGGGTTGDEGSGDRSNIVHTCPPSPSSHNLEALLLLMCSAFYSR